MDPMCPLNFRVNRQPGRTSYIRNDVTDEQLETLLTHPGEVLKTSDKAEVRRVGHWVVKESRAGMAIKAVRHTLLRDRYRRPWLAAHHLRAHRVRVPEPLAFVEKERLGLTSGTVFVFQYLAGQTNVEEFLLSLLKQGAGADAIGGFLGRLAEGINSIEAAGAHHADLSGKNIFTREGDRFFFIDLDAVSLDTPIDEEARLKNHVQLYDSFCDALNDSLMVPFIEKMLPGGLDLRVWMPRVRKAQQERRVAIEAKWDKQGIHPRRIRDELPGA
jgi:tRNA A-37 threonylcarbamoyl transferase component Bud32